jgi:uncharacterized protein
MSDVCLGIIPNEKSRKALINLAQTLSPVWVACSGGIDSLWLLYFFKHFAGIEVRPVFFDHPGVYPQERIAALAAVASENGVRVDFSKKEMVAVWGDQKKDRCYRCKRHLFERALKLVGGSVTLCDGTHVDDSPERRPGMRALTELGVVSPLRLSGWNKEMIREAAREAGLAAWNSPARACLVVDNKFDLKSMG